MSDITIVRATFADRDEAARVARLLVGERLAACASLGAATSIYRWRGAVEEADEVVLTVKTLADLAEKAAARIADLHSYDLPVIERWPVTVDKAVAQWVREGVGGA